MWLSGGRKYVEMLKLLMDVRRGACWVGGVSGCGGGSSPAHLVSMAPPSRELQLSYIRLLSWFFFLF